MTTLQRFHDLSGVAARARREGRVIVLLVSQKECPYCHKLKEEVLQPMVKAGDFADKILLGEIFMDAGEKVVDFDGREVAARDFAHRHGVYVTPTLLFLSPDGKPLAEKMVGITTIDMYFYYLSEAIESAVARLRAGRR
jgi:thioredoxin-related protein